MHHICLSLDQSVDIWDSTIWLLPSNAYINIDNKFSVDILLFLLSLYLGVELLSYMVIVCVAYQTVFQSGCTVPFCVTQQQHMRILMSPHLHQHLLLSQFLFQSSLQTEVAYHGGLLVIWPCITKCHSQCGLNNRNFSQLGWKSKMTVPAGLISGTSCLFLTCG